MITMHLIILTIGKLTSRVYAFDLGVGIPGTSQTTGLSYCDYMAAIYKFALNAGFALATLMIIFAGYKYLTSQGNSTAVNDAKDIIIGAIIGFVVLVLAKLILNILGITDQCGI